MTKDEVKKHYPVIQAFINGAEVEYYNTNICEWEYVSNPIFDMNVDYRIKREDVYIPFTFDTFNNCDKRWVKIKHLGDDAVNTILSYDKTGVGTITNNITYKQLLENYMFSDGTPCGVKQ